MGSLKFLEKIDENALKLEKYTEEQFLGICYVQTKKK